MKRLLQFFKKIAGLPCPSVVNGQLINRRILILGTGTLFCLSSIRSEAQEYLSHSAYSNFDFVDAKTDASGNTYIAGNFNGTIDLDPGAGVDNVSGDNNFCIIKLDANGDYLWGHAIGGNGNDKVNAIEIDASGKVYLTGFFNNHNGTDGVDFDPVGDDIVTSAGSSDIFLWVLNADGTHNFVQHYGSTGADFAGSVALDASGNIFVGGLFFGTVDFNYDPVANSNTISSGDRDLFTLKLASNGDFVWVKQWGNNYTNNSHIQDHFVGTHVDGSGNVITVVSTFRPIDMDPGAGTDTWPDWIGGDNYYIIKLDTNGDYVWGTAVSGTDYSFNYHSTVDLNGNVYILHRFTGTIDLDPGAGLDEVTAAIAGDQVLVKVSSAGNYEWGAHFSEEFRYQSFGLATDKNGDIYVSGTFGDATVEFTDKDHNVVAELTKVGSQSNGFIQKLSSSGQHMYVRQFSGTGSALLEHMIIDDNLDMSLFAQISASVDMDPNAGVVDQAGPAVVKIALEQDVYFSSASSVDVPENQLNVVNVIAKDFQDPAATLPITYSITGGTDQALFNIDGTFGILSFKDPHTWQAGSNDYQVEVTAQNTNESNTQLITATIVDVTPPSVTITSSTSSPTKDNPVPVTVTFSETVTGFEEADLTVSGGSVSNFSGSGDTYTFDLVPTGRGVLTVDVAADVAVDASNNNNTAASQFSMLYVVPVIVTNTNTSGAGSLDQAIQDFIDTNGGVDSILFDASLKGQAISITKQYSISTASLVIFGDVDDDGMSDITLQSDGNSHRLFNVSGTATLTINNLTIIDFTSGGGGVISMSSGTPILNINNAALNDNSSSEGGVINFSVGNVNIKKSVFNGNSSSSFGGVIYYLTFSGGSTLDIENSLFTGNTGSFGGGVIYKDFNANATIRHATFANNVTTSGRGGAIENSGGTLRLENCLFADNSSSFGNPDINGGVDNAGGNVFGGASSDASDYFTDHANGDYSLSSTSPAVNVGDNSLATAAGITTDIAGNAVPYDGIVDVVDAGAYEFQGDPPISFESASVINSGTLTVTLTFDRSVTGLDNADFTTRTGALSLTSLTTPDNIEYTATFTLADLTERAVDTVFLDALVEDVLMNNLQARDTFAFIHYVPVAQVTNTQTSGDGSLNQALLDFINSQGIVNTVEFDPSLSGSTIMVTRNYAFGQGTLMIDGDLDDDGTIDITLQSDGMNHGFFNLNGSTSLTLNKLRLSGFTPSSQWGPVAQVNSGAASLIVTGCELMNNSSGSGNGGAIYCENGNVTIRQSIFGGNSGTWGGAVTIYSGGTTIIENSLFFDNSAGLGGAIYGRNGAHINVRHCTFSGNTATVNGGAIYNLRILTVENSLFVNNAVNAAVNNIRNDATINDNGGNIYGGESSVSNDVADYFTDAANDDYSLNGRSLAADQGDNTLATNAGITADLLGNTRPFAGTAQVVDAGAYELQADPDFVAPTVSIATTSMNETNDNPIPVTITFSESVTGFESTDITLNGGTLDNFAGSGANYSFDLIPDGDGTLTVDIAANAATDAATNGNTAAPQLSVDYDGTAPTVSIATIATSPTNSSSIPVTVTFSESVSGFESADLTVVGATIENFTGAGAAYSFDLIPSSDGTLTVDLAVDLATDAVGNGNTPSSQLSIVYDNTAPTVMISTTSSNPTNGNPIPVKVTFSEPVTGFEASDLVVNGGTVTSFAGSGADYSFDLTPSAEGTITVDLGAATASDAAGNENTPASQLSIVYDSTSPTVTMSTTSSNLTNDNPVTVTVTFSEPVTGFEASDLVVDGGMVTSFAGSGTDYSFDLIPSADGTITVDLGASTASDAAGNGNTPASQLSIVYDGTAPTATMSTTSTNPTNSNPIPVTVTFSESVTGFEASDLVVTGGTVTSFAGSRTDYSFDLIPSTDGAITVDLGASAASDAAGNGNIAPGQLSLDYDGTAPVVTINILSTEDTTPELSGTIDDPNASISVTVDGQTLDATNNGNGSWTLADNLISELAIGIYDVAVVASDAASNSGSDITTDELTITATPLGVVSDVKVVVYPNPTTEILSISSEHNHKIEKVQVFDASGIEMGVTFKDGEVNVSHLANGQYFLLIHMDRKTSVKRFKKL